MPACPMCKGSNTTLHARARDIEYFTMDREFDIRTCPACDVLFVDPMLSDRLGEIYPPNYYSFQDSKKGLVTKIKEALDQRAMKTLTEDIEASSLGVLDIGGGTGWLIDQVKRADPRVAKTAIVDIDPGAKSAAEAKGHDFFLGRFEEYEPTDGRFDLILMLNLIEHVVDPAAVLVKAASLLRPGGRIWLKTPNFDSLDARLFRHRSWAGYHTPRHFVIFNRKSFERTARSSGLSVAAFSYTQGAPFWSISLLDVFRRMGLVKVSAARPAIYHPLTPLLQAGSAAFDFLRMPFSKTSQMVFTLKRADE